MSELVHVASSNAPPVSTDVLRSAADYAKDAAAANTRRAYGSDFKDFERFCAAHGASSLPAEPVTVAAYLASLADAGRKASTITRRCAAIRYAHRLRGLPPPTAAEPVKAVLAGIRRRIGVAVARKAPATGRALVKVLKRIDAEIAAAVSPVRVLRALRDRALLLIGFSAALRRSELVDLKVNDVERTAQGIVITIGRSKTDQEGLGHTVAVPAGKKLKPVEALDAWLKAGTIESGPLFRAIDKRAGGSVKSIALSDKSVALIVKRRFAAAGFDAADFAGHSLRAGFVTTALEHKADMFKVMDVTRHRSVDTLRGYDRRAKAFKDHAGKDFL